MQVCVAGKSISTKYVRSEVPQGSILGPPLFLIYMNSIASGLTSHAIFADDLKICVCTHPTSQGLPYSPLNLQRDIDILFNTTRSWGLNMNTKKMCGPPLLPSSASYTIILLP